MNLWLVVGAIGCGIFGFLTCLLWMRTKSWTARVMLLFFAVACIGGVGFLLITRFPFLGYTTYYGLAEEAMAPDWEGVKKIRAELSNTSLTLLPGAGALWITKRAPTQKLLQSMQVELARETEDLVLRTLSELFPERARFDLSLAVPVEIEELQVQEKEGYVTLKIYGLNLTKIILSDASLTMVGGKVSLIQMSGGSLYLTRVEVQEVVAAKYLFAELTDPVVPPQGMVLSFGWGHVTLRAQTPLHLILETGPKVLVSLPAGVSYKVEELGVGKRWELGPAELPPITVRMEEGKFRWISP